MLDMPYHCTALDNEAVHQKRRTNMDSSEIKWVHEILINEKGPLLNGQVNERLRKNYDYNKDRNATIRLLNYIGKIPNSFAINVLHPKYKKSSWVHKEYYLSIVSKKLEYFKMGRELNFPEKVHTTDLKTRIIEPWIEQLPEITPTWIRHKKLTFINDVLYEDFKNHINKNFENPFHLRDEFNKLAGEFIKVNHDLLHYTIYNIISDAFEIEEDIYLEFYDEDNFFGEEPEEVDYMTQRGEFVFDFRIWILQEIFKYYPNFEKKIRYDITIKEIKYYLEFYVNDIFCGAVSKSEITLKKDELENRMYEIMDNILHTINKFKRFSEEIEKYVKLRKKIINVHDRIKTSLEKHKSMPILPNKCDYLP